MPKPLKTKPAPEPQVIEELRPGQSIELLKELHILTREGKLNQDSRRKLKLRGKVTLLSWRAKWRHESTPQTPIPC